MTPRAWGGLAVVALLLGFVAGHRSATASAAEIQIVRLTHERSVLTPVYVHDTIRVRATRTIYDSLRDTVLAHLTDTLVVERFVTAADTAIRACTVALHDCDRLRLVNDSLAQQYAKLAPKWYQRVTAGPTVGCVIGVGGRSACGVGIAVGWNLLWR